MAFSRILGQEQAVRIFSSVLRTGRLAHAYLLLGPPGVGKRLMADELAKAAMCENPQPDACDACGPCQRFGGGRHADVHVVAPAEGKRNIAIDDIKSLQGSISLKAVEGGYKTYVIDGADRMTIEAANAFLKTLEEPPPRSLLLLVASTRETLIDTIVSRCQIVRFRSLAPEVVASLLGEQCDVAIEQATALANFAGGSIGRAVTLVQDETESQRDWVVQAGSELRPENAFNLAEDVLGRTRKVGGALEETRARLREFLTLLMIYYRDLLVLRLQAESGLQPEATTIFNADRVAELGEVAGCQTSLQLEANISRIIDALAQLNMNVNVTLIVESLLVDLARGPSRVTSSPMPLT